MIGAVLRIHPDLRWTLSSLAVCPLRPSSLLGEFAQQGLPCGDLLGAFLGGNGLFPRVPLPEQLTDAGGDETAAVLGFDLEADVAFDQDPPRPPGDERHQLALPVSDLRLARRRAGPRGLTGGIHR